MSFYLEEECNVPFAFPYASLAEEVVNFCIAHENFPYEAEVNLTLTDNDGIHTINKEYRQIDRPLDAESDDDFNPDTGEAMLGDIIISVEKVQEQAKAYGHSEKREFAFLIVHSMLHLFGYDHMTPEDAAIMEPKQKEILEAMNISREE